MNWEMLGHEWAVNLLKGHVAHGEVRHAYLFTGPQGIGRRTLAVRLAQSLNCPSPVEPGEPCLTCVTCRQIGAMQHPDLFVVQAEPPGTTLKVEQVRELQNSLVLSPYQARYRVAILLRFEEAHVSAANAFLKTLEEPASNVVIVVTAESSEKLLPTVVSRCQVLRLQPVPVEHLIKDLRERWKLPTDEANLVAAISGGRPGYAYYLHNNKIGLSKRSKCLEDHSKLLSASRVERFRYSEGIYDDVNKGRMTRQELYEMLGTWLSLWRDVLITAAGSERIMTNPDREEEILDLTDRYRLQGARKNVLVIETTLERLRKNVNLRLAMDVLLLDLAQSNSSQPQGNNK